MNDVNKLHPRQKNKIFYLLKYEMIKLANYLLKRKKTITTIPVKRFDYV